MGLILFDSEGYTLYRFEKDRGTTPSCYGACARKWPPVLTEGKPRGRAIYHTKLSSTKRKDGTTQVTYAGHPLYTFSGDEATGDTNGNGMVDFGGKWHALHPSGEDAEEEPVKVGRAALFAASAAEVGIVLFDERGYTLYTFDKDKGANPTCYDACSKAWPPFLTEGKPKVVAASAAKVGTIRRRNGTIQVTYAGHPLYFFGGDKSPGQAKGNDVTAFGGEWYAIRPNGQKP